MLVLPSATISQDESIWAFVNVSPGVAIANTLADRLLHDFTSAEDLPESLRHWMILEYLHPRQSKGETRIHRMLVDGRVEVVLSADADKIKVTLKIGGVWDMSGIMRHCKRPEYWLEFTLDHTGKPLTYHNGLGVIADMAQIRRCPAPA